MSVSSKLWITRKEAMRMCGLSNVATFEALAQAQDLREKFRSGRRVYFARADVEALIAGARSGGAGK